MDAISFKADLIHIGSLHILHVFNSFNVNNEHCARSAHIFCSFFFFSDSWCPLIYSRTRCHYMTYSIVYTCVSVIFMAVSVSVDIVLSMFALLLGVVGPFCGLADAKNHHRLLTCLRFSFCYAFVRFYASDLFLPQCKKVTLTFAFTFVCQWNAMHVLSKHTYAVANLLVYPQITFNRVYVSRIK